jgi:large-conductance mechanosensitive channel
MAVDELLGYAGEGVIMALFDFLVMAVVVWGTVRIISRWLRTQEGITQRQIKELEQRLHVLETQQMPALHKRISVLEDIFVTDDVA